MVVAYDQRQREVRWLPADTSRLLHTMRESNDIYATLYFLVFSPLTVETPQHPKLLIWETQRRLEDLQNKCGIRSARYCVRHSH